MELRKLSSADMQQVRDVWKTCFQDTDAFIDTYFSSAVSIESGIGFFDGDKLLSDLFMFDITADISGMTYPSQFIAGCATLPEARNQHLMRDLIRSALNGLSQRGISVCFLHPFLHSFYRRFGFETVSYVDQQSASAGNGTLGNVQIADSVDDIPFESLYMSFRAYVDGFDNHFMRTRDRMNAWLHLLFSDGGKLAWIPGGKTPPYAMFYEGEEKDKDGNPVTSIIELVYFSDDQLKALLNASSLNVAYFLPCGRSDPNASEFTMMRVIDPKTVLQWYPYPSGAAPFVINIHDSFLGNDYNFRVTPASGQSRIDDVESPSDIVADITDVATLCTGTYDPRAFPRCDGIFPLRSSCYFETY